MKQSNYCQKAKIPCDGYQLFSTVLFINTWILKFKSQLRFAFFASVNHHSWPLTSTGSKVHGLLFCDWWILIHFVCFCVSSFKVHSQRFIACDHNHDWQQQKAYLWRRLLNFRVCVFLKSTAVKNTCTVPFKSKLRLNSRSPWESIIKTQLLIVASQFSILNSCKTHQTGTAFVYNQLKGFCFE